MGVVLYHEPSLRQPVMFASWPGIGNVGVLAVDTLRQQLEAEELGQIEPWDFFYPNRVTIRGGVLDELEFPSSRFYLARLPQRDVLLFVGEEQPSDGGQGYAEGARAYRMANLVVDVARRFGCRRIYTSGAAVALTHHSLRPRVWAVASSRSLLAELKRYPGTVLMSEVEGRGNIGSITGLNGLLIGVARQHDLEGICLMGEVPDYLSRVPFPYPRAARSVVEVFAAILGISPDLSALDEMARQMETVIANVYQQFPAEVRERIDQRQQEARAGGITEEDKKWIQEHIDELFKKGEDRQ